MPERKPAVKQSLPVPKKIESPVEGATAHPKLRPQELGATQSSVFRAREEVGRSFEQRTPGTPMAEQAIDDVRLVAQGLSTAMKRCQ